MSRALSCRRLPAAVRAEGVKQHMLNVRALARTKKLFFRAPVCEQQARGSLFLRLRRAVYSPGMRSSGLRFSWCIERVVEVLNGGNSVITSSQN